MSLVLDTSVAMAWCFPDERTAFSDKVLEVVGESFALVPSIWLAEVCNAIVTGERRKRISPHEVAGFLNTLKSLDIRTGEFGADRVARFSAVEQILLLARTYRLTAYDAEFLYLAKANGMPLATGDDALIAAAIAHGVEIFT